MQGITHLQDQGLKHVAQLKSLRHLDFGHCWRVTDEGIEFLLFLPFLVHLELAYCWQVALFMSFRALRDDLKPFQQGFSDSLPSFSLVLMLKSCRKHYIAQLDMSRFIEAFIDLELGLPCTSTSICQQSCVCS